MGPVAPQSEQEPQRGVRAARRYLVKLSLIALAVALACGAVIGVAAASGHSLFAPGLRQVAHTGDTVRAHSAGRASSPGQPPQATGQFGASRGGQAPCLADAGASQEPGCAPCVLNGQAEPGEVASCPPCGPTREGPGIASVPCVVGEPTPTTVPFAAPAIWFCPGIPVAYQSAPGPIALKGFVCGVRFRAGERVTLTASGRGGSMLWQVSASASGTFEVAVPSTLCRSLPQTVVAVGATGDRSNTLTFPPSVCFPAA